MLLILLIWIRWGSRKHQRQSQKDVALLRRRAEGIPLETVGADGLPPYRRTGKPGEVPPGYHATTTEVCGSSSSSTMPTDEATLGEGSRTASPSLQTRPAEAGVNSPPPVIEQNGEVMAAPSEPINRRRNLIGKIWYGREPARVDVDQRSLWKRFWTNKVAVPVRPPPGPS